MATTDYLGLTLTGADETGTTFKDWRQAINGTTDSNMTKIDAGVKALSESKADIEGDWTLLETVTTSSAVQAVACSKTFSGRGIMACFKLPSTSAISLLFGSEQTNLWVSSNPGTSGYTISGRCVIEDDHGFLVGSMSHNIAGWGSGTLKAMNSAGTMYPTTTLSSIKLYTGDGTASIPSGTEVSFYYRK